MNPVRQAVTRFLRGPRASALLARIGVDPRRYWLLVDLFGELSDRGEMLDQLGTNQPTLKTVTRIYFGLSVLLAAAMAAQLPLAQYRSLFLVFTGFIMLSVLLTETGNSLLNPVEGQVLAHQPIDGATYTAAKLTHLALVILYLVPGLNAAPAIAGLAVAGSSWWYPLAHMGAALALGIAVALSVCALFGWLLRFVPARRLRATAQLLAALPLMGMAWLSQLQKLFAHIDARRWLQATPAIRWSVGLALAAVAAAGVLGGIRSLSADFLIRVSGVMHGGATGGTRTRRSWTGALIARWFGGQAARAGSAFLTRMMLRDWQFRRQFIPLAVPMAIFFTFAAGRSWRIDPFAGRFSLMHAAPHVFGFMLLFICFLLPYGSDYKAVWFFLTIPAGSLGGFARGVWASLWLHLVLIPHLVLLIPLAAIWGVWHGTLFVAYSGVVASLYLSLELRIVESAPFMRQPDASRGATALPIMMGAGAVAAIIVALQYFLVFRSPTIVVAVTGAGAAAAWFLTRHSLRVFADSLRFHLGLVSAETTAIYQEIDL